MTSGALSQEAKRQQRKLQQELQPRRGQYTEPSVSGPERAKEEIGEDTGPKFKLNAVRFSNSKFISSGELNAIAARYVGREITFSDLQRLVADVNGLYSERGIITALATLPPQKIKKGVVRIRLTEGRHAETRVVGAATVQDSYVLDRVPIVKGETVDPHALKSKIRHYNLRNTNQLRALLKPGRSFGQTDLELAVTEPATNTLQVFLNNQGAETTGPYQRGLFWQRYGLLGLDDRMTLYATNARKTFNGDLSYNFPVGRNGSRAGVSLSRGEFLIVDGPFRQLDITGVSDSVAFNYAHLIAVDERRRFNANFSGSFGRSETHYSDVRVTEEDFYKGTAGVSFSHSSGRSYYSIAPDIVLVQHQNEILSDVRKFALFKGAASAILDLPYNLRLTGDASWQYTNQKLLPGSQLFQIGGPSTVRGYAASGVGGDSGYLLSLELHRKIDTVLHGLDIYAFADHGAVYSTSPQRLSATSAGVGLKLDLTEYLGFDVSVSVPFEDLLPDQDDYQIYGRIRLNPLALR